MILPPPMVLDTQHGIRGILGAVRRCLHTFPGIQDKRCGCKATIWDAYSELMTKTSNVSNCIIYL